MKLVYTHSATQDLARLRSFIAKHNPTAAARIAGKLRQSIKGLREAPRMGRPIQQSTGLEIRQMVFSPYVVRYLVTEETVMILRVWHGKEDRPE